MKKIVLIEDNRVMQQTTKAILTKSGYEVYVADNAADGLALVESELPALVLIDVLLPGGTDGLDVCHSIRSSPPTADTAVVILSSLHARADIAAGILYGADDYLVKPIDKETLVSTIERLTTNTQ